MNRTLKLLIASDTLWLSGMGLVSPILAIYITGSLGGALTAVGIATTIFLATRITLQLVFSKVFYPKDRFFMVIAGAMIIAVVPFVYMASRTVLHLYIAQAIYGVGTGLAFPAWFSLFASNLSKGKEGFEWSIYTAFVGVGTGTAAYLGSLVAARFGFHIVFFLAGCLAVAGMIILLGLQRQNLKKILPHEMFVSKHKLHH